MKPPPSKEAAAPPRSKAATTSENESHNQATRQTPPGKPFIPAWLDDAGLTAAEFRVFCHLCRSADNKSGIAWPSYERMVKITGLSSRTIRRAIEKLASPEMGLIAKAGKPFAGSCRYQVLPIVPPEHRLNVSNSATTAPIDESPIVPPEPCNKCSDGTSIVPPEHQEGSPKKDIQRRVSNQTLFNTTEMLPFNSEAFREAWDSWKRHLSQKPKAKRPTAEAMASQLKKLASMGEKAATAALLYSTANSYQGVYPDPQHIPETGRPASFDELKSHAEKNGVAVAIAEKYWDTRERVGWKMRGSVMTDWQADFRAFADDWNRNEQRRTH
jgi:hypothetical protein